MGLSDFCTELSRLESGPSESTSAFLGFICINTNAQSQNLKLAANRPSRRCLTFFKRQLHFSVQQIPLTVCLHANRQMNVLAENSASIIAYHA